MLARLAAKIVAKGIISAVKSTGSNEVPELREPLRRHEAGDHEGAENAVLAVIAEVSKNPFKRSVYGRATALLATILEAQGRFRLAEKTWARAVPLLDNFADREACDAVKERLVAARQTVLDLANRNDTTAVQTLLARVVDLAERCTQVGQLGEAERLFGRAHTIAVGELGEDHETTAYIIERHGSVIATLRPADAARLLERAAATQAKLGLDASRARAVLATLAIPS